MEPYYLDLFKKISTACGVSGYTKEVADIFLEETQKLGLISSMDSIGSVAASIPSKNRTIYKPHNILITAHIDNIGYIVYKKDYSKQELQLAKVGIPYLKGTYPGIIITKKGRLDVEITDEGEDDPYFAVAQTYGTDIDTIEIGDPLFYNNVVVSKPSGKFTGAFMDNKASIISILMALKQIVPKVNYHNLFFVLTSFEEIGGYGGVAAATKINPFFTINLDVFPVDTKSELSNGVIINTGPIFNPILTEFASDLAVANKIPHKVLVANPSGASDANTIIGLNGGIPVCEIGTPCINLHEPNEMISKKSLISTADLLAQMCLNTEKVTDLIPRR